VIHMVSKIFILIKKKNINLSVLFIFVFISFLLISIPAAYISYNSFSIIQDEKAKMVIKLVTVGTLLFIGLMGLFGWIITMGIYYHIIKLFSKIPGLEFRKFLYIAGYLFPVKALIILTMTIAFFKVYGFSGFQPEMTAREIESFFIAWNTAKIRIEIFSSYVYLSLLALTFSTAYGESKKKTLLAFLIPYTTWIVFTALLRSLVS